MSRVFNTTFAFNTTGLNGLLRARNIVSSLGGTSWGAFNQMSRAASSANREFMKIAGTMGAGFGIGLLGRHLVTANAELQTNKLLFTQMIGNGDEAAKMMGKLQDNAAEYGYDLGEVFKSARGLYSGFSGGGRIVSDDDLSRLMKLTEAANMMDTENRGLSFAAFSLKEVAQGLGRGDYKSIKSRLEISIGEAQADAITASLKKSMEQKGSVKDAITLLEKAFKDAKIDVSILDFMAKNGFYQNLNALKSYVERVFLGIGGPITTALGVALNKAKMYFKPFFAPGSAFMASLDLMGQGISKKFAGISVVVERLRGWIMSPAGMTFFNNIQMAGSLLGDVFKELGGVVLAFFKGLGIQTLDSQNTFRNFIMVVGEEMKYLIPKLTPFAYALGKIIKAVIDLVAKQPELFAMLLSFNLLGGPLILGGIAALIGNIGLLGGAITGAAEAAGGMSLANMIYRLTVPLKFGGMLTGLSDLALAARVALIPLTGPIGILGAIAGIAYAFSQTSAGEKFFGGIADNAVIAVNKVRELLGLLPKGSSEAAKTGFDPTSFTNEQLTAVHKKATGYKFDPRDERSIALASAANHGGVGQINAMLKEYDARGLGNPTMGPLSLKQIQASAGTGGFGPYAAQFGPKQETMMGSITRVMTNWLSSASNNMGAANWSKGLHGGTALGSVDLAERNKGKGQWGENPIPSAREFLNTLGKRQVKQQIDIKIENHIAKMGPDMQELGLMNLSISEEIARQVKSLFPGLGSI